MGLIPAWRAANAGLKNPFASVRNMKCASNVKQKKLLETEQASSLFQGLHLILCAAPSHMWHDFYSALPNV